MTVDKGDLQNTVIKEAGQAGRNILIAPLGDKCLLLVEPLAFLLYAQLSDEPIF